MERVKLLLLLWITTAIANPCANRTLDTYPYPHDCQTFIICWLSKPYLQSCPDNLYYDVKTNNCLPQSATLCCNISLLLPFVVRPKLPPVPGAFISGQTISPKSNASRLPLPSLPTKFFPILSTTVKSEIIPTKHAKSTETETKDRTDASKTIDEYYVKTSATLVPETTIDIGSTTTSDTTIVHSTIEPITNYNLPSEPTTTYPKSSESTTESIPSTYITEKDIVNLNITFSTKPHVSPTTSVDSFILDTSIVTEKELQTTPEITHQSLITTTKELNSDSEIIFPSDKPLPPLLTKPTTETSFSTKDTELITTIKDIEKPTQETTNHTPTVAPVSTITSDNRKNWTPTLLSVPTTEISTSTDKKPLKPLIWKEEILSTKNPPRSPSYPTATEVISSSTASSVVSDTFTTVQLSKVSEELTTEEPLTYITKEQSIPAELSTQTTISITSSTLPDIPEIFETTTIDSISVNISTETTDSVEITKTSEPFIINEQLLSTTKQWKPSKDQFIHWLNIPLTSIIWKEETVTESVTTAKSQPTIDEGTTISFETIVTGPSTNVTQPDTTSATHSSSTTKRVAKSSTKLPTSSRNPNYPYTSRIILKPIPKVPHSATHKTNSKTQQTFSSIHETNLTTQETDSTTYKSDSIKDKTDATTQIIDRSIYETDSTTQISYLTMHESDTTIHETDSTKQETYVKTLETDSTIQETDSLKYETNSTTQISYPIMYESDTIIHETDLTTQQTYSPTHKLASSTTKTLPKSSRRFPTSFYYPYFSNNTFPLEIKPITQKPFSPTQKSDSTSYDTDSTTHKTDSATDKTNSTTQETDSSKYETDSTTQVSYSIIHESDTEIYETDLTTQDTQATTVEMDSTTQQTYSPIHELASTTSSTTETVPKSSTRFPTSSYYPYFAYYTFPLIIKPLQQKPNSHTQKTDSISHDTNSTTQQTELTIQEAYSTTQKTDSTIQETDSTTPVMESTIQQTDLTTQKIYSTTQKTRSTPQEGDPTPQETDFTVQDIYPIIHESDAIIVETDTATYGTRSTIHVIYPIMHENETINESVITPTNKPSPTQETDSTIGATKRVTLQPTITQSPESMIQITKEYKPKIFLPPIPHIESPCKYLEDKATITRKPNPLPVCRDIDHFTYPDFKDCTHYYKCSNGMLTKLECQYNFVFNAQLLKCMPASQTKCHKFQTLTEQQVYLDYFVLVNNLKNNYDNGKLLHTMDLSANSI